MKNLVKVLCPGHAEKRVLLFCDVSRKRFWAHCPDKKCGRWVRIDINNSNGITTTMMPKDFDLHFDEVPTVVHGV